MGSKNIYVKNSRLVQFFNTDLSVFVVSRQKIPYRSGDI
jgi:hypothetical protein